MTSYSSLNTHRICPQQWNYKYIRGLESLSELNSPYRIMGSWWHLLRACDAIERGAKGPDTLSVEGDIKLDLTTLDTSPTEGAWQLLKRWERSLPIDDLTTYGDALRATPVDRLAEMDKHWRLRWEDELAHEEPLFVEVKVERELPPYRDLLTDKLIHPNEPLRGRVDEIYRDTKRGFIVVRDYKSHKTLSDTYARMDGMDSQLHLYAWAVAPFLAEQGLPSPRAVAYDRARLTGPRTPTLTKAGGLSKSITDYPIWTYLDWLDSFGGEVPFVGNKKDGSGAGVYTVEESVVKKLSDPGAMSAWHQRTMSPLNVSTVKAHLSAASLTYLDTTRTEKLIEREGQAPRAFSPLCQWCDYSELCRAELAGGVGGQYDLTALGLQQRGRKDN